MSPEQAFVVNHSQRKVQSSRNSMTRGCPVHAILLRKIWGHLCEDGVDGAGSENRKGV